MTLKMIRYQLTTESNYTNELYGHDYYLIYRYLSSHSNVILGSDLDILRIRQLSWQTINECSLITVYISVYSWYLTVYENRYELPGC